jgi:hypothetical protein
MNTLVVFFSKGNDGRRLVGVGLTDAMIDKLKEDKYLLEPVERTKQDTDVVVAYGATLNELMANLKVLVPNKDHMKVDIL